MLGLRVTFVTCGVDGSNFENVSGIHVIVLKQL